MRNNLRLQRPERRQEAEAGLRTSVVFIVEVLTTIMEAEQFYCPICNELMTDGVYLKKCGHNFCSSCISNWLMTRRRKKSCPICRHDACAEDIKPCRLIRIRFLLHTAQVRHGSLDQTCEVLTRRILKETVKYNVKETFYCGYWGETLMVINRAHISPSGRIEKPPDYILYT